MQQHCKPAPITQHLSTLLLIVVLASCASGLEQPVRDIKIRFDSLEYISTDDKGLTFAVNGKVHNPNEFSIRPLHFTYQISLDGRHFEKGDINVQGKDGQFGLSLDGGKPEINKNNQKLFYKSNSPFRFLIVIPYSQLGGFAKAMERETLPYTINFIFTDERDKRATLSQEGNVNLTAILQPLRFRNLVVEAQAKGVVISFGLFNGNGFDLTMESCSYQILTSTGTINSKVPGGQIQAQANRWKFFRIEEHRTLAAGTPYVFEGGCALEDSWFGQTIRGVVQ